MLDPNTRTLDKLANINICLFAAFESESLVNFNEDDFEETLKEEVENLDKRMGNLLSKHTWVKHLNVYLLTFPLDNKRDFVASLHQKLKGGQQI